MRHAFLLALETDGWQVARVDGDEILRSETPALDFEAALAAADKVAETLQGFGYAGEPVCLGLPSNMVMAAQVDSTNLPRRNRRTAMLYRLEEQLPLEAERLTADFLPAAGGRSLGMAVDTGRVRAIVDRLAEVSIETAGICPTALVALQTAVRQHLETCDYCLVATAAGVDICRMAEGKPFAWYSVPAKAPELIRSIQADLLIRPPETDHPTALVVGDLAGDLAERVERETGIAPRTLGEEPMIGLAARGAAAILRGDVVPWADFRRDGLAPANRWERVAGPVRAAGVLGLALLVTVSALCYWRATRYEALAGRFEENMGGVFKNLYPNQTVPVNVKSRLRSEVGRLAGLSGADGAAPMQPSALATLRQTIAALPPALRFRLVEVRIDSTGILLEGEARNHSDAETIARALSRPGGLQVDSPRTESLVKGGVAFTLVGKFAGEERSAEPGGATR
jgi:hypothetical protein